jgi:hypothetical protein
MCAHLSELQLQPSVLAPLVETRLLNAAPRQLPLVAYEDAPPLVLVARPIDDTVRPQLRLVLPLQSLHLGALNAAVPRQDLRLLPLKLVVKIDAPCLPHDGPDARHVELLE